MESLTELKEWDPLADNTTDQTELLDEMKKKEIRNILRSYTGLYDLFAELIQNSLDALDMRCLIEGPYYEPQLWIHIDIQHQTVSVSDNGIGLTNDQLYMFLKPNLSFKKGNNTRGNKGVGATYLAYGFNYLQIATRVPDFEYTGTMEKGRECIEDTSGSTPRPHIRLTLVDDPTFANIDRGASFTVKLSGNGVRPKDLSWIGATTADQWDAALRIKTPLGGIYLFDTIKPHTICHLKVTGIDGQISQKDIANCEYFYPNMIPGKHVPLSTLISYAEKTAKAARPIVKWPPNYSQLTSIYDAFTADEILANTSPLKPTLTEPEIHIMKEHKPDVAVYFVYSTHFWDNFNDNVLQLRPRLRILRGGLQLATQGMIQGELLGIPLTFGTGYQSTTLVFVHYHGAEPDLGRKGFQPELVTLAEKLAVASVNAFKAWYMNLRKDTGQPIITADADKYQWIVAQEEHAKAHPLQLSNSVLFAPEQSLPIISTPMVEQDVVALFNQLLAAGVIRGFQVLANSGYQRYDCLVKIHIENSPIYLYDPQKNPLGVPSDNIQTITSAPMVLEYKYQLDALIDDFSRSNKFEQHVNLAVAWTMGERWKESYQIVPLLHKNYIHDRHFHGITHEFINIITGAHAFYGIILDELIQYLNNADGVQQELYKKYMKD